MLVAALSRLSRLAPARLFRARVRAGAKSGARALEATFQKWLTQNEYPQLSVDDSGNRNFGNAAG